MNGRHTCISKIQNFENNYFLYDRVIYFILTKKGEKISTLNQVFFNKLEERYAYYLFKKSLR